MEAAAKAGWREGEAAGAAVAGAVAMVEGEAALRVACLAV